MVKKDSCSHRTDSVRVTDINQAFSEKCHEKAKQDPVIKNTRGGVPFFYSLLMEGLSQEVTFDRK